MNAIVIRRGGGMVVVLDVLVAVDDDVVLVDGEATSSLKRSWTAPRSWTGWSRAGDRPVGRRYPLNGRDIDRRARREQRRHEERGQEWGTARPHPTRLARDDRPTLDTVAV